MRRGGIGSRKRLHMVVICFIENTAYHFRVLDDVLIWAIRRDYTSLANMLLFPKPRQPHIRPFQDASTPPKSAIVVQHSSNVAVDYSHDIPFFLRVEHSQLAEGGLSFQRTHLNPFQWSDQDSSVHLRDDSGQCTKVTAARESWYASHWTKTKCVAMFGIISKLTSQSRNSGI